MNIEYFSFDENVDRETVACDLDRHATKSGSDCGLINYKIRWLDSEPICENQREAEKRIDARDRGGYDNLAVRYYQIEEPKDKKMQSLKRRTVKAWNAQERIIRDVYACRLKAEYISCRHCGSKLKRVLLGDNECPVCRCDLRPEGTLRRESTAMARYKRALVELNEYRKKGEKTVKWLVKIEYA